MATQGEQGEQGDQMSGATFGVISGMWLVSILLMMINIYQSGAGDRWFMIAMIVVWVIIVAAIYAIYAASSSNSLDKPTAKALMATTAAIGAVIPMTYALIVSSYSPGSIHRQSLITVVLSFAGLGAFLYAV